MCMFSDPRGEIIICFNEFASSGPPNSAHYYLQFAKWDNGGVELNHQLEPSCEPLKAILKAIHRGCPIF